MEHVSEPVSRILATLTRLRPRRHEPIRVLSLGAGVQSTTVALMIKHGDLPPVDCTIFSDTGWEPKAVYAHLDWLEGVLPFPIHRVSAGNIRNDILRSISTGQRFAHRSCVPLDQVDFRTAEEKGQLNLFINDCEGMCGV